jgi:hypothetical protein
MSQMYGGRESLQVQALLKRSTEIAASGVVENRKKLLLTDAVAGALTNLEEEVRGGLLAAIERRVTSDVLSDFVQLARAALAETGDGAKNVAAVLAAAAFEDTLRRVAKRHAGVIGQDKLFDVVSALKESGLLVAPQLGIAQSYLQFRNLALHAEWSGIERAAVESCLGFVEQFLMSSFE